jgi:hypothetical protein
MIKKLFGIVGRETHTNDYALLNHLNGTGEKY